jgi:hypothetical protein
MVNKFDPVQAYRREGLYVDVTDYDALAARLAEAERRLDERPKTWWLPWTPLETAQRLHDAYEELAPHFGYTTRPDTRQFDPDSPNGQLMIATIRRVLIEQAASATVADVDP